MFSLGSIINEKKLVEDPKILIAIRWHSVPHPFKRKQSVSNFVNGFINRFANKIHLRKILLKILIYQQLLGSQMWIQKGFVTLDQV